MSGHKWRLPRLHSSLPAHSSGQKARRVGAKSKRPSVKISFQKLRLHALFADSLPAAKNFFPANFFDIVSNSQAFSMLSTFWATRTMLRTKWNSIYYK